jgi:hypothetical protein
MRFTPVGPLLRGINYEQGLDPPTLGGKLVEIQSGSRVFLVGLKSGIAQNIGSVILELSVALTPEDITAGKADSFELAIAANYADKVISDIRVALQRLRQSN